MNKKLGIVHPVPYLHSACGIYHSDLAPNSVTITTRFITTVLSALNHPSTSLSYGVFVDTPITGDGCVPVALSIKSRCCRNNYDDKWGGNGDAVAG